LIEEKLMSVAKEREYLVPNIPVSILQLDSSQTKAYYTLSAGDVLYLPSRVVHCGTAVTDDCVTLSVGCRAPSATDLVARIAESLQLSTRQAAVERYTDEDLLLADRTEATEPSLTHSVKESMKKLVRNAIEDLLEDDRAWDDLVGKITTEAIRYSDDAVRTYSEQEDEYRQTWGETASDALQRVMRLGNRATLVPAPGFSFATSRVKAKDGQPSVDRLFSNGQKWEVQSSTKASMIFHHIERGKEISGATLTHLGSGDILDILEDLVREGILQACERNKA
jgi:ribosomal protein L16 Arg81 hydroxylase